MFPLHLFLQTARESGPSTLVPRQPAKGPHAGHAGNSQRLVGNRALRERQCPNESAPQRLPAEVREAYRSLVALGFTKHLITEE